MCGLGLLWAHVMSFPGLWALALSLFLSFVCGFLHPVCIFVIMECCQAGSAPWEDVRLPMNHVKTKIMRFLFPG